MLQAMQPNSFRTGLAPVSVALPGSSRLPSSAHCLLLAGGLSPSPLASAMGFPVLHTLVKSDATVLDLLLRAMSELGIAPDRVCLLSSGPSAPHESAGFNGPVFRTLLDAAPYRGPAGAVRDALSHLDGDGPVLIAEASRIILSSLCEFARIYNASQPDVIVGMNPDRSPAGVFLAQRQALAIVPATGFVDLKEQWLGKFMVSGPRIGLARLARPGAFSLRTRTDLLEAARAANEGALSARPGARTLRAGICGQRVGSTFSVVHPRARVQGSAAIIDSIIMAGAVVEKDAVVVRSLVCPGALVAEGQDVVDSIWAAKKVSDR